MSPSQFLVDTENLQLDARDIARLNQILTSTAPGYPQDTENLQLDAQDLARLNSALTSMLGVDSENLKLSPHDIAVLKPHLIRPYAAKAVHDDGAAYLSNASVVGTPSFKFTLFGFVKSEYVSHLPDFARDKIALFQSNSENFGSTVWVDETTNFFSVYVTDEASVNFVQNAYDLGSVNIFEWNPYLVSVDSSAGPSGTIIRAYCLEAELVFNQTQFIGGTDPIVIDIFSNTLTIPCNLVPDPPPPIQDMAVFRLFNNLALDLSVAANRRLFYGATGKPVDPAVATAALGTAGVWLLNGDASTFHVNQGTGGAFTLTGTLTNASTSPSD